MARKRNKSFIRKLTAEQAIICETIRFMESVPSNGLYFCNVWKDRTGTQCRCGRRIVCKHMVAIYLTVFPNEAKRIYETLISDGMENEYDEWDEYNDEDDEDAQSNRVIEYVCKMKKSELQQALLQVLFDGSEWQYERFIEERGLSNE